MPPAQAGARLRQRRASRDAGDRGARRATGKLPTPRAINDLLTADFFLPFANKAAHKEMRESARKLVFKYVNEHQDELTRTWATERPFELYLDGVVVSGRADVIYDEHDGVIDNLAIVDYKTSTGGAIEPLQLQVYADAGRREGLTVGGAFIHDMGETTRHVVDVSAEAVERPRRPSSMSQLRCGPATSRPSRNARNARPATCGRSAAPPRVMIYRRRRCLLPRAATRSAGAHHGHDRRHRGGRATGRRSERVASVSPT